MVATECTRGELPGTASADRVGWQWVPAYPGQDGRDGTLGILLTRDRRKGPRTEFFWYAVTELECPAGGRRFALVRDRAPKKPAVVCVVGGLGEACSCEAARYHLLCKHRRALSAMVQAEAL